jgi:hypothetical protein
MYANRIKAFYATHRPPTEAPSEMVRARGTSPSDPGFDEIHVEAGSIILLPRAMADQAGPRVLTILGPATS